MNNSQAIKQAIHNMGGPTRAGFRLEVSANTVHKWIRNGVIPRLDKAEQVAAASGFDLALLRPRFEQEMTQSVRVDRLLAMVDGSHTQCRSAEKNADRLSEI